MTSVVDVGMRCFCFPSVLLLLVLCKFCGGLHPNSVNGFDCVSVLLDQRNMSVY